METSIFKGYVSFTSPVTHLFLPIYSPIYRAKTTHNPIFNDRLGAHLACQGGKRSCCSTQPGLTGLVKSSVQKFLGGGFDIFFVFLPLHAKMIQFDLRAFFKLDWFNHQFDKITLGGALTWLAMENPHGFMQEIHLEHRQLCLGSPTDQCKDSTYLPG